MSTLIVNANGSTAAVSDLPTLATHRHDQPRMTVGNPARTAAREPGRSALRASQRGDGRYALRAALAFRAGDSLALVTDVVPLTR